MSPFLTTRIVSSWWWPAAVGLLFTFVFSDTGFAQARLSLYAFIRVVDSSTPIPGGSGNFVSFTDPFTTQLLDERPAVAIRDGIVAFSGSGEFGQRGVYVAGAGGSIAKIADTNTLLPDGSSTFRLLGTPSLSQGTVAFSGSGTIEQPAQGVFFAPLGGVLRTIVDRNTVVPGGTGVFRGIGQASLDDRMVVFVHASVGKDRLFVADTNGGITFVASTTIVFNGLSFAGGVVAFIANQRFVFAAPVGTPPVLVASALTVAKQFALIGFNPSIDNSVVAFLVQGFGIYLATLDGSLTPVCLVGAPIPGGTGNFIFFDADSPSHRDGIVAFRGFGASRQEGIYASIDGSLIKIIDLGDSLDGKPLIHVFLGYEAVSRDQIVFAAQFADGSRGLYQLTTACQIPDPFVTLVGGVCLNAGWLPRSHPLALGPAVTISPGGCTTPDPFAGLGGGVCINAGWLPPGISVLPPTLPPSPPTSGGCSDSAPAPGWVCMNGGWLPPTHPLVSGGGAPPLPPASCTTPDPFTAIGGGVCINGGWVRKTHPLAGGS